MEIKKNKYNSTKISKDLSLDLEAVDEASKERKKSSKTKCDFCEKSFKRLSSHARFCKAKKI